MVAAVLTYPSLLADVLAYTQRSDDAFQALFPTFLAQAENRIAADAKMLGTQQVVTGELVATDATVEKPAFWRQTTSIHIQKTDGTFVPLYLRSYEFCRAIAPVETATDQPMYYADYDYTHLLLAPTPDAAYPFRMVFDARITPLSDTQAENWLTQYAPQLLLRAVLLEAYMYLKAQDKIQFWQSEYNSALAALKGEDGSRKVDRATG